MIIRNILLEHVKKAFLSEISVNPLLAKKVFLHFSNVLKHDIRYIRNCCIFISSFNAFAFILIYTSLFTFVLKFIWSIEFSLGSNSYLNVERGYVSFPPLPPSPPKGEHRDWFSLWGGARAISFAFMYMK